MSTKLELLAPAKDKETAIAAILAGADAIFIGGPSFGARSKASNSLEELKEICAFAHMFNVKVHLTVNTLLYDNELDEAQKLIESLDDIGVDAIIMQDLALLNFKIPKGIELHASTQCDISDVEKLKFYDKLGFSQIVLPREITLDEIKLYREHTNAKLEAFVAGALCVAQSGICYISELMTKRSANRGECAHICRLPMSLYNKENKEIAHGHLISMKDNFALDSLSDLIDAGVSSFKIEGRLKDKDFVINQVSLFRQKLDEIIEKSNGLYERQSKGVVTRNFTPNPYKTFNRGFTNVMLYNKNDHMVNTITPKSQGEEVGTCLKTFKEKNNFVIEIRLNKTIENITNGDGFTYIDDNNELQGFRCNRASIEGKKAYLYLAKPIVIKKDVLIKRNIDTYFIKAIMQKDSVIRHMFLNVYVKNVSIDNENFVEISYIDECDIKGSVLFKNEDGNALNIDSIKDKVAKTSSLYHKVKNVFIDENVHINVPISYLNQKRREAFDAYLDTKTHIKSDYIYKIPKTLPHYICDSIDERLVQNKLSFAFYKSVGVDLDKKVSKLISSSLMTCRNCLVKNHALCKKDGGTTSGFYLVIGKDRFNIVCDCVKCRMHITK